ncbi:structural toxin protein [Colletotrichum truncatum]|uniref:Structural toxin protein n=1 Tax=Colletotrichum truncatum TaxID=5467 RepID=A0ACC3Z481_COLTU
MLQSAALSFVSRGNCILRHSRTLPLFWAGTPFFQGSPQNRIRLAVSHHRHIATTSAMADRYKLVYTVPASHLVATKDAVFQSGAGIYDEGKYVQVAFELTGQGQFMPVAAAGANPHTGAADQLERVLEYRVEILCVGHDVTKAAVAALKSAHPYEVPAHEVYKLEDF